MAHEGENRFHAAIKVAVDIAGVASIGARTAAITGITNPAPGEVHVLFSPGIGAAEEVHALCTDVIEEEEGFIASAGRCVRISDTEYAIFTQGPASGSAINAGFSFVLYRVSSSNGT